MAFNIRRILCPVDFSTTSTRAFHHALALASWCGAEVTVLHVHRVAVPALASVPYGLGELARPTALTDSERLQLTAAVRAFVDAQNETDVFVDWIVEEASDVAGAIAERGDSTCADLIVLGTHGYSGFRRFVLGSVTEQVLRRARRAVLAVPPAAASAPALPVCERILCPIDFSPGSLRALEAATAIASRAHATLTVAHIIELPPNTPHFPDPDWSGYRSALFAHAHTEMKKVLEPWRNTCQLQELVLAGNAVREILRLDAELQADLVVMGVHGRGAVDLMLFGAVTQSIVRQAACPVLAVPAMSLPCDC